MTAARARYVLLAAIAISLLVHLLIAGYIRWPALMRPHAEEPLAKVRIVTVARMTPRPPPSPPPTPAPTPRATPVSRASIAPPAVTTHAAKGVPAAPKVSGPRTAPPATLAPAPSPVAAASASSCVHSSSEPAIAATPDAADIPEQVRAAKVTGTAAIAVSLDPQGRVLDTAVSQSTGNAGLDAVAAQMARSATYTPKYVACKAVAGTYRFTVRFVAW